MTAAWMLYATCVGALVTLATVIVERLLHEHRKSARFAWITALAVALVWPVAIAVRSEATVGARPKPVPTASSAAASRGGASPAAEWAALAVAVQLPQVIPASPSLDGIAGRIAVIGPVLMLMLLLIEGIRVSRSRRLWTRRTIDNMPVLVSPAFGPAIVGVVRPQIVIPSWVLDLPPAERALMLTHEAEHLAARDSRWLALAFAGIVVAPWNVSLWWLVRRVRLSIEVECDQRVLRRGHDVACYANLLLETGRRSSGRSLLVAGFAERRSMLRARIDRMTGMVRTGAARTASQLVLGALLFASACTLRSSGDAPRTAPDFPVGALVGDSIVKDNDMQRKTKSAHDLPTTFQVLATIPATAGTGAATCPNALIDERDGTELLLEAATMRFRPDTSTGDANSASSPGVAYYSVRPAGRYGVESGEWLRVGCLRGREKNLKGTVLAGALTPSPLDVVLRDSLGVATGTLVRLDTRLDIAVTRDTAATSRQRARQIAAMSWRQLGGSASALDTITVRVEPRGDVTPGSPVTSVRSIRWVFYPKQGELVDR